MLARLLLDLGFEPAGMVAKHFRRQPAGDDGAVRMLKIDRIGEWLPQADHVVNTLPSSDATTDFFDADRFAKLPRSAFYYNIGRGTTNDEIALQVSLQTAHFAAAYVDAFCDEPLPPTLKL